MSAAQRRPRDPMRAYLNGALADIKRARKERDEARLKDIQNGAARAVVHTVLHGGGHMQELAEVSELARVNLDRCIAERVAGARS